MTAISKEIMAQIKAQYIDVGNRQHWHKYNAVARIRIRIVSCNTWDLYISPSRAGRPIDEAVRAILLETKVGKKILKKATRHLRQIKETGREMERQLEARRAAAVTE